MISDFDRLVAETAAAFQVPESSITGESRLKRPSMARQVVITLWTDHHPYIDAVQRVNRNRHFTAMYARERTYNRIMLEPEFAATVASIADRCKDEPGEPKEK